MQYGDEVHYVRFTFSFDQKGGWKAYLHTTLLSQKQFCLLRWGDPESVTMDRNI